MEREKLIKLIGTEHEVHIALKQDGSNFILDRILDVGERYLWCRRAQSNLVMSGQDKTTRYELDDIESVKWFEKVERTI